jgi:hypothetical protein
VLDEVFPRPVHDALTTGLQRIRLERSRAWCELGLTPTARSVVRRATSSAKRHNVVPRGSWLAPCSRGSMLWLRRFAFAVVSIMLLPAVAAAAEPAVDQRAVIPPNEPTAATAVESAPRERTDERPAPFDYTVPMMATDLALTGAFAASWTFGRSGSLSPGAALGGAVASYGAFVISGAVYHQVFDLQKKTALSVVVRLLAPVTFSAGLWASVHNQERSACRRKQIAESECDHDGAETAALVGALIGMSSSRRSSFPTAASRRRRSPRSLRSRSRLRSRWQRAADSSVSSACSDRERNACSIGKPSTRGVSGDQQLTCSSRCSRPSGTSRGSGSTYPRPTGPGRAGSSC